MTSSFTGDCKPLVRWAGSKKRSLAEMLPNFPQKFERYIEVFAGSACLYFFLKPQTSILSDTNLELMHFYKIASRNPEELYSIFSIIPRTESAYYKVRENYQNIVCPITRAANFYFLNRNCFNGIYRTNNKGKFNVPFAKSRVAKYPTYQEFKLSAKMLRKSKLLNCDFQHVCEKYVKNGDFIYLDPPYFNSEERVFREYSSKPFSSFDVDRLSSTLDIINERGGKFLLSYPPTVEIEEVLRKYFVKKIMVLRTVSGQVSARIKTEELIITNY